MNDAIVDKIRKLIAHEKSARKLGSLAEAEAFAEKIQAILIERKLSMADVDMTEERRSPIGQQVHYTTPDRALRRHRVDRWYALLFTCVAEAHFCQSIHESRYNVIYVIGREEDLAVAIEMFHYLLATMKRLASHERRTRKANRRSVRNFTNSFYRGFVGALAYRYSEARRNADLTESTALVLCRSDDEVKSRAKDLFPHSYSELPQKTKNRINSAARTLGWMRGNEVSLATNVIGGAGETKLLEGN